MATKYRIPKLDDIQGGINAFDDLADTIANPPAGRPLKQAIGNSGRLYCDFVGSQPGQAILPWSGQGLVAPLLCKPYWDSQGYDAPVSDVPFTGGQCAQVIYSLSGKRINSDGTVNSNWSWACDNSARGPIALYRDVFPTQINMGFTYYWSDGLQYKAQQWTAGPDSTAKITIDTVTRCDGLPDNCGNPPGGSLIPGPNPPPTPTFPPGEGPGTEPDGQPFFFVPPIDNPIGGDPIDVPPQPDPDPDPPGDDTPTNPGGAGDPEDTGAGGESSGCAPEGSELTGVFVEIVEFPENAARFQNNQRQPFRGAGYIAMGWPDLLGVDISGGVINLEQFFHAQQRGITCWRVTANTGFDLRCTPYYRELNPEEEEE